MRCRSTRVDDPKIQHDADAFVSGTTAMLFREAWVIGEIQEKNPVARLRRRADPALDGGEPHKMLLAALGIYVNGKSSNKQAAWDFLKFLTNPENACG